MFGDYYVCFILCLLYGLLFVLLCYYFELLCWVTGFWVVMWWFVCSLLAGLDLSFVVSVDLVCMWFGFELFCLCCLDWVW